MNIGIVIPGFSAHADDWAIPVQQHLTRALALTDDVRVIALRYPHCRQPYALDQVRVYPLGAGQARGVGRLTLWLDALRLIRRLHRQQPFDVLHAMWADETGLIAGWAGRTLRVPVVVSILGGELVGLRDIGYGLQLSRFSRWIVGQALTNADRVIVASRYVRQLVKQAGYPVEESRLIGGALGVDTDLFTPSSAPANPRRLINVASLVPVKDQDTLLRAVALVPDITLEIVGTGSEATALKTLAAALGISDRAAFHGAVAHPNLPAFYRQAGIKVLTSRHEILAMSTLEAAACGLPVITTNIGTLPDHQDIAITVPVGDHVRLAAAIHDLISTPQHYEQMRLSARAAVEREFSISHSADSLRAVYHHLAERPK